LDTIYIQVISERGMSKTLNLPGLSIWLYM